MVKRKKIQPEPEEPEELEEEPYVPEEGGLTYTMRYTVGMLKPEQSYEGSKCYGIFFETEKLVEAKKEAEKAFKEDNLEVVVWDREKWSSDAGTEVARYVPETEVKDDEDAIESRDRGRSKRATPKKTVGKPRTASSVCANPKRKKIPPSKRKKRKRTS
jgi:hypothetical protein